MRVLIAFGTRPEAIKMAPLIMELRKRSSVEVVICTTAQHRQMLDQVLEWFRIEPDFDLNVMQRQQTLSALTAKAIEGVTEIIERVQPDIVLTQGDTTTAMVTSLAAFYLRVEIGHVEAGLRTYDIYNPFPEEVNRRMISVMAAYNFAPTETAKRALLSENIPENRIHLTGNTVIDALKWTVGKPYHLNLGIPLDDPTEKVILVTAHRRESFGPDFDNICHAFRHIVENNPGTRIVYPVHLNPNVQAPVKRILGDVDRIHLIAPLPYPAFAHLMQRATLILTDSGGVQEEAPALGVPVLVMRHTTERPEAVEAGAARLVGTDTATIVRSVEALLNGPEAYAEMANAVSPFGDGHASEYIADILTGNRRHDS